MVNRQPKGRFEGNTPCPGKRKIRTVTGLLILLLVIGLGLLGFYMKKQVSDLYGRASRVKGALRSVAACLVDQDPDGAEEALRKVNREAGGIREALDRPFWKCVSGVPMVRSEFDSVQSALDILDAASADLIQPVVDMLRTVPPESLKQEAGFHSQGIIRYLTLAQDMIPQARELVDRMNGLELGLLDRDGSITSTLQSASALMELAEAASDNLLRPAIAQLNAYPLDSLGGAESMDLDVVCSYLAFAQRMIPQAGQLLAMARQLDAQALGGNEKIAAWLDSAGRLAEILENASGTVIGPVITQLQNYPLGSLTVDGGFNVAALKSYLDFARTFVPELERTLVQIRDLELGILKNEKIASYFVKVWNVTVLYHENEEAAAFLDAFLGDGEDRLYLLAAQNSAEIRASGGFPGAMGTIRIRDGVLRVEDFTGVNDMLAVYVITPVSYIEKVLFLGSLSICRDADFCPNFERVAGIWSMGYTQKNGEALDGVVSLTPAIIQKILAIVGDLTLSDGTHLTGENATRILQRDLYFKYFGVGDQVTSSNTIVDALFAETARETMALVARNIGPSQVVRYLNVLHEGCADRTIMFWMKDEAEQEMVRRMGWSGGLNTDPDHPAAGVYFNCTAASKMGWFLNMDTEIGAPETNSDGSRTYPMKITLENTMTPEELSAASYYIDGGRPALIGSMYLFAPAGGTVSDFSASRYLQINPLEYEGLRLGHVPRIELYYNKPLVITYNLTTAPGVDAPLTISQTPTLQAYR